MAVDTGGGYLFRSKLLVYDEHKSQTTEKVKQILDRECHTTLALVLPGATSKVQPLDVAFNSEFKRSVDRQATELMAEDPEIFSCIKVDSRKWRADGRGLLHFYTFSFQYSTMKYGFSITSEAQFLFFKNFLSLLFSFLVK